MSLLQTKWITDDAVNDLKIKLRNNQFIRARNAADSADVNIFKVNASDEIEFSAPLKVGSDTLLTTADKGVANGVASLDGSGKVPAAQLPSYVDDVEEYADLASFPVTGQTGKIYVALDTNKTYRWSGSAYVEISASDVNSVNGQTGVVVLTANSINYTQGTPSDWTVADGSSVKLTLDEVGSRLTAVEAGGGNPVPRQENITLTGTDITNGFVALSNTPIASSTHVTPKGGLAQEPGVDFSVTSAQLNFLGDLASNLITGDKLIVHYLSL